MKCLTVVLSLALLAGAGGCSVDKSILKSLEIQDATWALARAQLVAETPSEASLRLWDTRSRWAQLNIRRVRASLADEPWDMKAELARLKLTKKPK